MSEQLREAARAVLTELECYQLAGKWKNVAGDLRAALDAEAEREPPGNVPARCHSCGAVVFTSAPEPQPSPSDEERANTLWMDILHVVAKKDEMPPGRAGYEAVQLIGAALAAKDAEARREERERCAEACADVMRIHRADRQAMDARPDGAAEDWEAYQCSEAAMNAAIKCHDAIRALPDQ